MRRSLWQGSVWAFAWSFLLCGCLAVGNRFDFRKGPQTPGFLSRAVLQACVDDLNPNVLVQGLTASPAAVAAPALQAAPIGIPGPTAPLYSVPAVQGRQVQPCNPPPTP